MPIYRSKMYILIQVYTRIYSLSLYIFYMYILEYRIHIFLSLYIYIWIYILYILETNLITISLVSLYTRSLIEYNTFNATNIILQLSVIPPLVIFSASNLPYYVTKTFFHPSVSCNPSPLIILCSMQYIIW